MLGEGVSGFLERHFDSFQSDECQIRLYEHNIKKSDRFIGGGEGKGVNMGQDMHVESREFTAVSFRLLPCEAQERRCPWKNGAMGGR